MKIIKRNGSEVVFDITKIIVAITKANDVVEESLRMTLAAHCVKFLIFQMAEISAFHGIPEILI